MTKKIFIILAMAIAMISCVTAEAAPRCTCVIPTGTTQYRCAVHQNYCIGIVQHQHDDQRVFYRDIPVLCAIDGGFILVDPNGPSTKEIRKELHKQAHLQKCHERKIARKYARKLRAQRKARRNDPLCWILGTIERQVKSEIKREVRKKKTKFKRKIRKEVRDML